MINSLIQHFEADFQWKVSLKILNSGIILKTFTHEMCRLICALIHVYMQENQIFSQKVGHVMFWKSETVNNNGDMYKIS